VDQSILWRRLDGPGHESARLLLEDALWHLTGTAVFAHERHPCRLDYRIVCDSDWQTLSARVEGWIGITPIDISISVDVNRRWLLNGTDQFEVENCVDVDLNFSPSTNLLPIRRLVLEVGEEARVRAAWLRFPGFTLEPLEQSYLRTGKQTYRYESGGGSFVAELEVNEAGFVTRYPNFCEAEAYSD
jgi:uncharacterized protein